MSAADKVPNGATEEIEQIPQFPACPSPPLPDEGSGYFSNYQLAFVDLVVPWLITRLLPFKTGWTFYFFLVIILGVPLTIGYWWVTSRFGPRFNEKTKLPGKPLDHYIDLKNSTLRQYQEKGQKVNMRDFHEAYFDGKVDFKGDVLEVMEYRHDWATFGLTMEHFNQVLTDLVPAVVFHSRGQDQDQIQDTYDRGNDFYSWFLGPRMVYTSGLIKDIERMESLEELQDNKMTMVCEKLALKEGDRMLDIGCGWGTLATHAAKNYGADVTGVTLARNQAAFGNQRLKDNGISESQARILSMDFRDVPHGKGHFNKISCLEMAEHVGIRRYGTFLKDVYNLLADDGILVFQVAGIRTNWRFEDLVWGLFMNKYIFPGADASLPLGWVVSQLESANFEIKSIDVFGVHYAATIHRWYLNWQANKDKVVAKYGIRWYRIWIYFLAYSVIVARQGSSSVFQITCHKNLNAFHRITGIPSHQSIQAPISRTIEPIVCKDWEQLSQ